MLKILKNDAEVIAFTHRIEFDILMKDLSARKVEVGFNGWDEWDETGCCPLETANFFYRLLVKGLDKDRLVLGWKMSYWDVSRNKKIAEYEPYVKSALQ